MKTSSKKILYFILPGILLFIAVQYTVLSIISVRQLVTNVSTASDTQANLDAITDTSWISLYKEKTWLESRLRVAKTDSISLSINLKDSLMQLELKGVVLKSSKIVDYHADRFFSLMNSTAYHHYFGTEVTGESAESTIQKVPIVLKKAPKDSLEYASQSTTPDSTKTEEVHWVLELSNGNILQIEGASDSGKQKKWKNGFWMKQNFKRITSDLSQTIRFEVPEYKPTISIIIAEPDAKAIYRALPEKPSVCIRF